MNLQPLDDVMQRRQGVLLAACGLGIAGAVFLFARARWGCSQCGDLWVLRFESSSADLTPPLRPGAYKIELSAPAYEAQCDVQSGVTEPAFHCLGDRLEMMWRSDHLVGLRVPDRVPTVGIRIYFEGILVHEDTVKGEPIDWEPRGACVHKHGTTLLPIEASRRRPTRTKRNEGSRR